MQYSEFYGHKLKKLEGSRLYFYFWCLGSCPHKISILHYTELCNLCFHIQDRFDEIFYPYWNTNMKQEQHNSAFTNVSVQTGPSVNFITKRTERKTQTCEKARPVCSCRHSVMILTVACSLWRKGDLWCADSSEWWKCEEVIGVKSCSSSRLVCTATLRAVAWQRSVDSHQSLLLSSIQSLIHNGRVCILIGSMPWSLLKDEHFSFSSM